MESLQAENPQDLWGAATNTGWRGFGGWGRGGRLFVVLRAGRQCWLTAGVTVNMRRSTSLGKLEICSKWTVWFYVFHVRSLKNDFVLM